MAYSTVSPSSEAPLSVVSLCLLYVDHDIVITCSKLYPRALCSDTYPDVVCRNNYTRHYYDPPLLYDLHKDPGEIYGLDVTDFKDILDDINQVQVVSNSFCCDYHCQDKLV